MNNIIRGEYWIIDENITFADGDIGDYNHESIATDYVVQKYSNDIIKLAQNLNIDTSNVNKYGFILEDIQDLLSLIVDEVGEEEVIKLLDINLEIFNIFFGSSASLYVMKNEGWIAIRGMSIDLYQYDDTKRKNLENGIDEILYQENIAKNIPDNEIEFALYDFKTKKSSYITFEDIKSPIITARTNQQLNSKGDRRFQIYNQDSTENIPSQNKSNQNKWNTMSQQSKLIGPGQQLWRGTSESNMNFKGWLIKEMPITNFQLLGKWGPKDKRQYGYNKQDVGILQNPRGVEKIHKSWSNTIYDFEFYFLRSPKAYKFVEIGLVTPQWVKENLEIEITPKDDVITIIFTQNTGAQKIPMTAWMIAHRLGHAIKNENLFQEYFSKELLYDLRVILKEVYGINKKQPYSYGMEDYKELLALAKVIGTMKSVTQNNILTIYEFMYELIAQWLITGNIKFNPLPRTLKLNNRMAWGRNNADAKTTTLTNDELHEYNLLLENLAEKYEYNLESIFGSLLNKIFVM